MFIIPSSSLDSIYNKHNINIDFSLICKRAVELLNIPHIDEHLLEEALIKAADQEHNSRIENNLFIKNNMISKINTEFIQRDELSTEELLQYKGIPCCIPDCMTKKIYKPNVVDKKVYCSVCFKKLEMDMKKSSTKLCSHITKHGDKCELKIIGDTPYCKRHQKKQYHKKEPKSPIKIKEVVTKKKEEIEEEIEEENEEESEEEKYIFSDFNYSIEPKDIYIDYEFWKFKSFQLNIENDNNIKYMIHQITGLVFIRIFQPDEIPILAGHYDFNLDQYISLDELPLFVMEWCKKSGCHIK
jgi:hypothetical protein